jgi:molybdopterin converting factor small subunit
VRVEVRLFATLARYLPKNHHAGSTLLDVAEGSSVADVARALGIPGDRSWIALVNDRDAQDDRRLVEGDVVTLFPPLAGGAGGGWYTQPLRRARGEESEASRNPVGLPDFKSGVRL